MLAAAHLGQGGGPGPGEDAQAEVQPVHRDDLLAHAVQPAVHRPESEDNSHVLSALSRKCHFT